VEEEVMEPDEENCKEQEKQYRIYQDEEKECNWPMDHVEIKM
jgi:hypothetical protein